MAVASLQLAGWQLFVGAGSCQLLQLAASSFELAVASLQLAVASLELQLAVASLQLAAASLELELAAASLQLATCGAGSCQSGWKLPVWRLSGSWRLPAKKCQSENGRYVSRGGGL